MFPQRALELADFAPGGLDAPPRVGCGHGSGSPDGVPRVLIGAHVSAAYGLANSVARGVERECEAIQIFHQSPRMWRPTKYSDDDFAEFRAALADSPIESVTVHAVYLINCASKERDVRAKSIASLSHALRVGDGIGAESPQTIGGESHVFASWSNAGARNHTTVVEADTTLTANFERPNELRLAGTDVIGTNVSAANPGRAEVYRTVATDSGTVTELNLYLASTSTASRLVLGLYRDVAGQPTTLLGSAAVAEPRPAGADCYWA